MKELERKISIVVAVYNSEKTIKKCLDSIIKQNYSNKELIIVDNHSKDNSKSIIANFKNKYDFIKVYSSKSLLGGGVKNYGIKKSTGDYFIIVDSDDYLEPNALNIINTVISNKDYSLIRFNASYNNKNEETQFITNLKEGEYNCNSYLEKVIEEFFKENKIFGPSWLYVHNTKFFKDSHFHFKSKQQEDYGLTPQEILRANNIYVINKVLYNYVFNKNGMTNNKSNKMNKAIDVLHHSENHLRKLKLVNKSIKELFVEYVYKTLRRKYNKLNSKEKEIYLDYVERSDCLEIDKIINNNTGI